MANIVNPASSQRGVLRHAAAGLPQGFGTAGGARRVRQVPSPDADWPGAAKVIILATGTALSWGVVILGARLF
ncbi:hypothetical protein RM533_02580 [Croceicoccus sp. F390]|uniref:Uncharacterized protein n=1 Tax=Croceicoccus esteveae TaxID=3075597 RepID=A0ABU2ZEP0_9SPHN|nr:hypothetical protein [Croceicoccus sp. F390]MDT0575068.1 hypothetical protein [Croceicoccus sp. F390]